MELTTLSLSELLKLKSRIEKEIDSRNKKQRGQAMDEIKAIVAKYGLKFDEVIASSDARKPRSSASKKAAKPAKTSAAILYRHPDSPALTWSGGRGRRPAWVKEWEASGRRLDDARIAAIERPNPK